MAGNLGGLNTANKDQSRRSEVGEQLDSLSNARDRVEGRIQSLERRLQMVLRPTPPSPAAAPAPHAASPLAPLAQSLESLCSSFEHASERLGDLLERIELPE